MNRILAALLLVPVLSGCATLGGGPKPGPEFQQKIMLMVSDEYQQHQATRSAYDVGDLQSFHSQHTFPIQIQEAFKEIFSQVEVIKNEPGIEAGEPDVPAVFEVQMVDLANDIYNEADNYRSQATIAVAMKSPSGEIFWQQAFRGEGFVTVDPQFSTGLGPQDAVVAAVEDAVDQMKTAIITSPQVQNQLKYYNAIKQARNQTEQKI